MARPTKQSNASIADRRRRDLLEAAFALIAEKGLEGLRTRDIAARARVNIATLHYYFATKDALLVAAVHHVRDAFMPPEGRAPADDPHATLRAHFANAWRNLQANPRLLTVLIELTLRARRDRAARAALRSIQGGWRGQVETILRRGIASGRVRGDCDPKAGAVIVTSFIMGAAIQLGAQPRGFDFTAVAKELERWAAPQVIKQKLEPFPTR